METSLYSPVKRFLEGLGFEVKGEICGCDLVALDRGAAAAVVIGELKLSFTLELVLQAVDRSAACDDVWVAVRASTRGRGRESDPRVKKLCRLLGIGLLAMGNSGHVDVLVEPVPWRSRRDAKRRSKIVDEHRRRQRDPASGGSTRQLIMTAYRQQALACAATLARAPARPRDLKPTIPDAPKISARQRLWMVRQGRARDLHTFGCRKGRYRKVEVTPSGQCAGTGLELAISDIDLRVGLPERFLVAMGQRLKMPAYK